MSVGLLMRLPIANLLSVLLLAITCISGVHADQVEPTEYDYSQEQNSEAISLAAERWKLSEQEYRRYLNIMQGPLSRWNPNIDPVLALGLFAGSENEQHRFAELYALQEHDLTARTLAFEHVYRQAFARLFPESEIIDDQLLQPFYTHQQQRRFKKPEVDFFDAAQTLQDGDRLLMFPAIHCPACGQKIMRLLNNLNTARVVIDIYVKDADTDDEVRTWATSHGVAMDWIRQGQVTLNRDNGLYQRLQEKTPSTLTNPTLFLSRNNTLFSVDESVLQQ